MKITSIEIAERQLLTALQMWRNGDFISCITLAGAAEEILGKRMRKSGLEPSFDNIKETIVMFARHFGETETNIDKTITDLMNLTRNELKHYAGDETLEFDIKADAEEMLERAVSNYTILTGKFPEEILLFWESLNSQTHQSSGTH